MRKINRLKSVTFSHVKATEEQEKEIYDLIRSMMVDYVNYKLEEERERKANEEEKRI